jgi:Rieske Fe-S protein
MRSSQELKDAAKAGDGDTPRWREDFPIQWERDHYITRREFAKFLTLGSALLAGANAFIAFIGLQSKKRTFKPERIGVASSIPEGGSVLFRYPTDSDPCILVRTSEGKLEAYSQVCTHLSCAVVHRPDDDSLFCPCHRGCFSASSGQPTAGPPTRRLPRIRLEQRGDEIFAVDIQS